eukprot:11203329-Heterocapsa_arctica.AAC.1
MTILENAAEATHAIPARTGAHFGKKREQIRNRGGTGRGRANPAAHQGRGHTTQRAAQPRGATSGIGTRSQGAEGSRRSQAAAGQKEASPL